MKKKAVLATIVVAVALVSATLYHKQANAQKFTAPRSDAPEIKYRVIKENTLMAITGNLKHYGFIKDEDALLYALEHTQDTKPGNEGSIKVGSNDIDTDAVYTISQTMDAWQIAQVLLNEGTYSPRDCSHGCGPWHPFVPELLPGGNVAPPLKEQLRAKYDWVQSYESCVEAIGPDGGQASSKENFKQTGRPRECVSPDGRYFIQGQEGWSDQSSG